MMPQSMSNTIDKREKKKLEEKLKEKNELLCKIRGHITAISSELLQLDSLILLYSLGDELEKRR